MKKGVIIDIQSSAKLTKKISDKVWNIITEEENVPKIQTKYRIINISKSEDGVNIRILSDIKPIENNVSNVTPNLEDYYLYVFGNELIENT